MDDAIVAERTDNHGTTGQQAASSTGPLPSPARDNHLRPLHVVHLVSSLEIGGQERVVLDLSRGLTRRGHRVTVVSLAEGGALRSAFAPIVTTTVARAAQGFDAGLVLRLRHRLVELSPDVVHTHNPTALLYGAPAARLANVSRVVHTKHGANPTSRRAMLAVRRLAYRLCHRVVAVSAETAQIARTRERLGSPQLLVISNGIDVDAYARAPEARAGVRAELGIPADAVVIGTVGRLAAEKNHALLLEAASPLLGDRTRLVIVGDGPLRADLERAVFGDARRRVQFLGTRWDIARLLASFDLFVLSSSTEGLPLVVPEAMAAGLPIVATAVGGLPSVVIDGMNGRLVTAGDPVALRRALAEIVADSELRSRFGQASLQTASARFAMGRVLDAYEAVYRGG
jgi:glycosyltransferase involved in cell wall biosynthesis